MRSVVVLGLGRFGSALAVELTRLGVEVLGVDQDETVVQDHDGRLTHVVRADITREEVHSQLGVRDADRLVVAVGGRLEASVLACSHLLRAGVEDLWAKAESADHAQILDQLGVAHVIKPQHETGQRVAHRIADRAEEWVTYGRGFAMGLFPVPNRLLHRTAADARIAERFDVRLIARCPAGRDWEYVSLQTTFNPGDQLIVAGQEANLERFGRLD